jgi:hypothetical protein
MMNSAGTRSTNQITNEAFTIEEQKKIKRILIAVLLLAYAAASMAQDGGLDEQIYQAQSKFEPTIKDAVKFSDIPEIRDTVKRIKDIKYNITSTPLFPKYEVQTIDAAKMKNEPLQRLYHSLLKVGYGPIYTMPLAEFRIAGARAKESSMGAHLKHFSSAATLKDAGYSGFSDNTANLFGKKFYKRHTLSGDLNFGRHVYHYYGYDTAREVDDKVATRQRYQLIEPKLRLISHFTDSTHINHNLGLSFYHLQNLDEEAENNIKFDGVAGLFIQKEKLNVGFLTDFYNHKQNHDTLNDLIVSLSPSFEANGKKWHADIGLTGTLDNFKNVSRFYFYPSLNLYYDIYESIVIPYAGVKGGLIKNSFRSLSTENPFVDTTLNYVNTNNKYNIFGGLRGNFSSNTSYDAGVSFAQYDNLHFFVIDYANPTQLYNRFNVIYDNASVLNVNGMLRYQLNEKIILSGKGNYYLYKTKTLQRAYHKPDFDMTFSGIYNLKSKIILRADLFLLGTQWVRTQVDDGGSKVLQPRQIKGWADMNFEAEYRYTKMLSFFARFNNIANQRYYRWERYPSQRFNFMIGLTFVPF